MNPTITYKEKNGIELRFIKMPDASRVLELKKMGFRPDSSKTIWQATITEERIEFAKRLRQEQDRTSSSLDTQQSVFHDAFKLLSELIPDLIHHLQAGTPSGVLEFEKEDTHRKIQYDLSDHDSESTQEIILSDWIDEKKELQFDVLIYPDKQEAEVTTSWLSHYYQDKYGQQEEEETEDSDDDEGEVMTASMNAWLNDLLGHGHAMRIEDPSAKANTAASKEHVETLKELANEHVYTQDSTGDKFERIDIPIPKAAKWKVQINIVQVSDSDFRFGIQLSKQYDNYEGTGFYSSTESQSYPSRKEALQAALQYVLHRVKPSLGKQEDRKAKQAADAVIKFAQGEGIEPTENDKEEKQVTSVAQTKSVTPSPEENPNHNLEKLPGEKGNTPFSEQEKEMTSACSDHPGDTKINIPEIILKQLWKIAFSYHDHIDDVLILGMEMEEVLRHAPEGISLSCYEANPDVARIAQVQYPNVKIMEQLPEEKIPSYALVMGALPCGNQFEQHPVHNGLNLLKPGGLLIFLLPVTFMQGPVSKAKEEIAIQCKILDAYRLESPDYDLVILQKKEIQ